MPFDSDAYFRLEAPQSLGATLSGMAFATSTGDLLDVSSHGPGIFRLRAGADTKPDYGLVRSNAKPCTASQPRHGTWALSAGDTTLEVSANPLALRLLHQDVPILTSSSDLDATGAARLPIIGRLRRGEQWTAAFALASGEPVYGLGEKFGPLNKRGQLVHSYVQHAGGGNTQDSSKNTPFAWGPGALANGQRGYWGLYVHTPAAVTHGVGYPDWSHRSYVVVVDDEALDLFLFAAASPAGILDLYTQLTGRAQNVPLWSLGLWISGANFTSPEQTMALAANVRRHRVPCDVLMLGGTSAWKDETCFSFDWDTKRFPDVRATLAAVKAQHLKVAVTEYPYISLDAPLFHEFAARRFLLTDADGDPCIIDYDDDASDIDGNDAAPSRQSGLLDFTNPEAFAWWHDAHGALFADGVDIIASEGGEEVPDDAIAFNGDYGTRLHNVYPLLYNRCVHEATAKFHDENDPAVVLGSAGWAGSQRLPVQSTGDAQSDWEGLAASIRGALAWGMSGVPCHAFTVGGSFGAVQPSVELCLRWLEASVFASHIHVHGQDARAPWLFDVEAEATAKKWLAFRYRLIPYLQHAIEQASRTGLPLMRAMPLAFPGNAFMREYETHFMCGDALLVAPIVAPGGEMEIALPPGGWYDLNSRRQFVGQRVLRYKAALHQFPVFGREGYALPLGAAVQHTGEIDPDQPIAQLWVFGRPAHPLDGYAHVKIAAQADGTFALNARPGVDVQIFGDAGGLTVNR